jgi:hypothetical protein
MVCERWGFFFLKLCGDFFYFFLFLVLSRVNSLGFSIRRKVDTMLLLRKFQEMTGIILSKRYSSIV